MMDEELSEYELTVEEMRSNHAAFKETMQSDHEQFKEQMALNDAQDDAQMNAEFVAAANFMGAIANGDENKIKRSLSEFERLLNWHVDSRQIWKAGNSSDAAQAAISEQFLPEILANWEVDITAEDVGQVDLERFEELKATVGDDAAFLICHIEQKLAAEANVSSPEHSAPVMR